MRVERLEMRQLIALFAPDVRFGNGGSAAVAASEVIITRWAQQAGLRVDQAW